MNKESTVLQQIKSKARLLKREAFVLYFAYKDQRVAWYAKLFAICVVAYAFSPIDLIPDFIPVLGYLDDIILVPLGVWIALKLIPDEVVKNCRAKAKELLSKGKPKNWFMGILFICVWVAFGIWITWYLYNLLLS